ncbi:hypothetical protein M3148_12925 [Georgenia satyanarayanai]|uniref:hypothetical protein n=1 Tax=Georgenia satyanarayanai TaxID=860221 RepID=UPI002040E469|nr:hypothetical protein [Georgenia satyanarayanai]MCM3661885.1 hypothetical protein [Georgenia satyanarayanai]
MASKRQLPALATLVVLYVAVATLIFWLAGLDVGRAFLNALVAGSLISVAVLIGIRVGASTNRATTAREGYLGVSVRSPDGHPRLSKRWRKAEVRPAGREIHITPLAGPSVAPFTVSTGTIAEFADPRGWRDLLMGPIGTNSFLRVIDAEGVIEISVHTEHLSWLLEGLETPDSP